MLLEKTVYTAEMQTNRAPDIWFEFVRNLWIKHIRNKTFQLKLLTYTFISRCLYATNK